MHRASAVRKPHSMRFTLQFSAALLIGMALGSVCATAQKKTSTEIDYMESSARYMEPFQTVAAMPVVADLKVTEGRIAYTEKDLLKNYSVTEDLIKIIPGLKSVALCRAAKAHNADVILCPSVDVITTAEGKLEITITGYPAVYSNFRNATGNDIETLVKAKSIGNGGNNSVFGKEENLTLEEVNVVKK